MKASALFGADWADDSLEVLWRDARRACKLRRDDADGDAHVFIPIPSGSEHPTLESVNRLTHEHGLQRHLDGAWALRPLELLRERGQSVLDSRAHQRADQILQEDFTRDRFGHLDYGRQIELLDGEQPKFLSEEMRAGFRSLRK